MANISGGGNTVDIKNPKASTLDQGSAWIDDGSGGCYVDYQLYSRYVENPHKLQLPLAGDTQGGPTSVIVQVAAPTWGVELSWTVSKEGTKPRLPQFDFSSKGLTLLHKEVEPHAIQAIGDGSSFRYSVSGRYIYAATTAAPSAYTAAVPPNVDESKVRVTGVSFIAKDFALNLRSIKG